MSSYCIHLLVLLATLPQVPANRAGGQGNVPSESQVNRLLDFAIDAQGWRKMQRSCAAVSCRAEGAMTLNGIKLPFQMEWLQTDFIELEAALTLEPKDRPKLRVRHFISDKAGWRQMGTEPLETLSAEAIQPDQHEDAFLQWMIWGKGLVFLRNNSNFSLQLLAEPVRVRNKPVHVVQVQRRGYPRVQLCFDVDSYLLVRAVVFTGDTPTLEMDLSGHQLMDGLQAPRDFVLRRQGKEFAVGQISELKLLEQRPILGQPQQP